MKNVKHLKISGAFTYTAQVSTDTRGGFSKLFNCEHLKEAGVDFTAYESFYTSSKKGDLRGMHVQAPPNETSKIVTPLEGVIYDVLLDLRKGSVTYQEYVDLELDHRENICLYVPIGVAHGFQCISNTCKVLYFVNGKYVSSHDVGIRYDSFKVDWPIEIGDMSDRDQLFPVLDQFNSPFSYVE